MSADALSMIQLGSEVSSRFPCRKGVHQSYNPHPHNLFDFLFNSSFPNTSSTHKLSFILCSKNVCLIWFMGIYVYRSLMEKPNLSL